MSESPIPSPESLLPEAKAAYSDEAVEQAFLDNKWFTPSYINGAHYGIAMPARRQDFTFENKLLNDFFLASVNFDSQSSTLYLGVKNFLHSNLLDANGNSFPLRNIPFITHGRPFGNMIKTAYELGTDLDHIIDRADMFNGVETSLLSIIAPKHIRRETVRVLCNWGESEAGLLHRRNVLLVSRIVKHGVDYFMKERTKASE